MTTRTPAQIQADIDANAREVLAAAGATLEAIKSQTADPLASGRAKLAAHNTASLTDEELAALKAVAPRRSGIEILAIDDQETADEYVPQWDTIIPIRSMTGTERDHYEASLVSYQRDAKGQPQVKSIELDNLRARLISLVAMDGNGGRLWTQQQVLALGEKNAVALDQLFQAAQRLSKLTAPAIEAAKEALGNAPSGELGSDSPGTLE
jgi:hypothetical protein